MALTFLLTTLWSVEVGVAISVTISLLMVVHRSSRARMSILVSTSFALHSFGSHESIYLGASARDGKLETDNREPGC
jgi:MFS superfamily sulfate permease-like transporter